MAARQKELDAATIRLAQKGDRAAFVALVVRYQVPVHALLYRMLHPVSQEMWVADLAQETFLRVYGALQGFDPRGPARLSTWILTIATRLAVDHLRRPRQGDQESVEAEPPGSEDPSRPDTLTEGRLRAEMVRRALSALSEDHRAVLLLREFHELDYGEIAEGLGIDVGTVKSRLFRARAALREALKEEGADER